MTLGEHLEDLRRRVLLALLGPVVGFVICFFFLRQELLSIVINPVYPHWKLFGYALPEFTPVQVRLTMGAPYTAFTESMFISLLAGTMLTIPWSLYHLWAFVAAGLTERERRGVRLFAPVSLGLFVAGATFFYFVVYPVVLTFLYGFSQQFNEHMTASGGGHTTLTTDTLFDGYVSFVMLLIFVFGLMFELPLVVFFLGKLRLVSVASFRQYRRHVIMAIVILSAVLTPPDVFSQMALAIPMVLLYELGVLMVAFSQRGERKSRSA